MADVYSWWQADDSSRRRNSHHSRPDPSFEAILKGSFEHMSEDAKCNFKARLSVLSRVGWLTVVLI